MMTSSILARIIVFWSYDVITITITTWLMTSSVLVRSIDFLSYDVIIITITTWPMTSSIFVGPWWTIGILGRSSRLWMVWARWWRALCQTPVGKSSLPARCFMDFKFDVSFPQTIECDASDFTVLFTFVGLVPAVCWTSGGKFHYIVVWRQFILKVPQIISQWWLGHSLGGKEHDWVCVFVQYSLL